MALTLRSPSLPDAYARRERELSSPIALLPTQLEARTPQPPCRRMWSRVLFDAIDAYRGDTRWRRERTRERRKKRDSGSRTTREVPARFCGCAARSDSTLRGSVPRLMAIRKAND
jgi:hypothetical protein